MDAELLRFDAKMREVWGYSESTRAARCRIVKRFLIATVGTQAIDINGIAGSDVSRFIIGDGTRSASCARGLSGAIRSFLRYRRLIGDDVTHLLSGLPRPPRPKPSTLPDVLTDVEVDTLLQSFSADFPQRRRAFAIARCLIDLGMRSSEVAGLTLEDIDWQRGTIRVTHRKGRRADILPLLEATGKAIADYILHERPAPACLNVFVRHRPPIGEPIGRRAVQTTMLAAYRRLGWDRTRVHILRHTLATRLLARGTPMPVIADVMGHRSLDTTVIYTKLDSAWLSKVSLAWPGGAQ
jgi:integrase